MVVMDDSRHDRDDCDSSDHCDDFIFEHRGLSMIAMVND